MKRKLGESVYCPFCGGPSRGIERYSRSVGYKCEGRQQCGYFSIVNRRKP